MIRIGNLDLGHLIDTLNYLATPTPKSTHPSLKGISRKIVTRELVYYILLGTLRSAQKCLWSNLRASFFGDIHP